MFQLILFIQIFPNAAKVTLERISIKFGGTICKKTFSLIYICIVCHDYSISLVRYKSLKTVLEACFLILAAPLVFYLQDKVQKKAFCFKFLQCLGTLILVLLIKFLLRKKNEGTPIYIQTQEYAGKIETYL